MLNQHRPVQAVYRPELAVGLRGRFGQPRTDLRPTGPGVRGAGEGQEVLPWPMADEFLMQKFARTLGTIR